ncbi:MAG TPA: NAD(P)-dependent oxidoreductase [Phnomibacter sp.]|nr:NAD(P)-dependent oxidoreductase [Phnomibacter sp.]
MHIFISGASGFIGGHFVKWFVKQGHTVWGMSRSPQTDVAIKKQGGMPIRCSLQQVQAEHLGGAQVVIHAAAMVAKWASYNDYYNVNVQGTANLLEAARQAGVRQFVFISSEAVLFNGKHLLQVDEQTAYPARMPFAYCRTKQQAERLVIAAHNHAGMHTVCLRPRMVWGPGEPHLLPRLLEAVRKNKFWWLGGGQYHTSTTHVYNLCHAVQAAVEQQLPYRVLFVADDEVQTLKNFIQRLMATQGVLHIQARNMPAWLARLAAYWIEGGWRLSGLRQPPPVTRIAAAIFTSHCIINQNLLRQQVGLPFFITVQQGMEELQVLAGQKFGS